MQALGRRWCDKNCIRKFAAEKPQINAWHAGILNISFLLALQVAHAWEIAQFLRDSCAPNRQLPYICASGHAICPKLRDQDLFPVWWRTTSTLIVKWVKTKNFVLCVSELLFSLRLLSSFLLHQLKLQ